MKRTHAAFTAGALISLLAGLSLSATAQTATKPATPPPPAAAKPAAGKPPAAKPAAAKPPALAVANATAKANTLGSGEAAGALLTRDELRVCLKQEESIRTRIADLDQQQQPLAAEKAAIGLEQQAVREERIKIDGIRKIADELGARFKAYGARVETLNARVAEFNASKRSGAAADRERVEMNTEQAALVSERTELESERQRLTTQSEVAVRAYNDQVGAVEARVADWNERNAKWADRSTSLESERKGWLANCSDKRYREDDEIAIRKEK